MFSLFKLERLLSYSSYLKKSHQTVSVRQYAWKEVAERSFLALLFSNANGPAMCRCLHGTPALEKKMKQSGNERGRSVQAQRWLARQERDPYVRRAHVESYRCRSAFKLMEIDDQHAVLAPGQVVVDCGAAPGSWCQVAVKRVNALGQRKGEPVGKVIGVDLQHMMPVEGATLLHNTDFTKPETQAQIMSLLQGQEVDTLISDMAPNASGMRALDHELAVMLCASAARFASSVLRQGGTFLGKILQGPEQGKLEAMLKIGFEKVRVVKPQASRTDSAEIFLLAKNFRRPNQ